MSDHQEVVSCHDSGAEITAEQNPFRNGLWKQNPVFVMVLGMCPTLAITNSVRNAISMGLATTFVMVCSYGVISMIRKLIPKQVRIATYIAAIATGTTVVEYLVKAMSIPVYQALGAYIPLIVSNCLTLERAEAYAGKQPVVKSMLDGLGMGMGFTFALTCLGTVREVLGAGTFLGVHVLGANFEPWVLFLLPPGGFISLAMWLLAFAVYKERKSKREERAAAETGLPLAAEVQS